MFPDGCLHPGHDDEILPKLVSLPSLRRNALQRFEVEREYVATVDVSDPEAGQPGDALVAALREGVSTADGVYKADVAGIDGRDVRVVVREGKHRMVRR